jgi:serine/threonine-protein phosphatase 6 regulatory ankyrin repeat subunit A/serine/threonine-protein phosphatase 6 regulatory ankyrin repeat subunit B
VVVVLLEHGVSIEARVDGSNETALHLAATHGREDILRLLLNHGAHIEAQTNDGMRALHLAVHAGQIAVVKLLLAYGVDSEARIDNRRTVFDGWTALQLAIQNRDEENIQLLG